MKQSLRATLFLVVFVNCTFAFGQGFPRTDFKPRTLSEIVRTYSDMVNSPHEEGYHVVNGDTLLSKVRVTYAGASRPVSEEKGMIPYIWAGLRHDRSYLKKYESEMLFVEGSVKYWLPVNSQIIPELEKGLKSGDRLELYVIQTGCILRTDGWDWAFLVQDFQKANETRPTQRISNNSLDRRAGHFGF